MRGKGFGVALVAAALVAVGGAGAPAAQAATCSWMNTSKSPERRADELVGAMSYSQKLHATTYSLPPWFFRYGTAGHVDGVPSLCLPDIVLSDAGAGVVGLQQGTLTFPSGVAQAAMWDPKLARRFGKALGEEAFAKLDSRAFSYWNTRKQGWTQARGCYGIRVGNSSRSLPLGGARRTLAARLRGVRKGARVRRVTVYVNGRKARVQPGKERSVTVALAGRAKQRMKVRLVARTSRGTVTNRRTYRLCGAG